MKSRIIRRVFAMLFTVWLGADSENQGLNKRNKETMYRDMDAAKRRK